MNNFLKLIYLITILSINFACVENKKFDKENIKSELLGNFLNDSLKFNTGIRVIFQDSKGNYWFGSQNEGIGYYDGKSFEYFTVNDGLAHNQIRSIQEDKKGIIWIGTAKGVSSYNGEKFKNYFTDFNSPKLNWNTTNGDLWFYAGEEDGINRFDGMRNMNYLIFPKPVNDDPYKSYGITGISKDNEGKVWIATYSALFNYDGKKTKIFNNKNLNLENDDVLHIRSVLADSKGRIWIGNNGIGVILKEGDSVSHFSKEQEKLIPMNEFKSNIQNNQTNKNTGLQSVFAIEEDASGNIWFGDRDSGAWKYDGNTLTNFSLNKVQSAPMIWTIYKDNNNNLLFGLANGAVLSFDGKTFVQKF